MIHKFIYILPSIYKENYPKITLKNKISELKIKNEIIVKKIG
jgi:hypothetical protein